MIAIASDAVELALCVDLRRRDWEWGLQIYIPAKLGLHIRYVNASYCIYVLSKSIGDIRCGTSKPSHCPAEELLRRSSTLYQGK